MKLIVELEPKKVVPIIFLRDAHEVRAPRDFFAVDFNRHRQRNGLAGLKADSHIRDIYSTRFKYMAFVDNELNGARNFFSRGSSFFL